MKIRTKMLAIVGLGLLGSAIIGIVGVVNILVLENQAAEVYRANVLGLQGMNDFDDNLTSMRLGVRDLLIAALQGDVVATENAASAIEKAHASLPEAEQNYAKTYIDDSDKKNAEQLAAAFEAYYQATQAVLALLRDKKVAEADSLINGDAKTKATTVLDSINAMVVENSKAAADSKTKGDQLTLVALIAIGLAFLLAGGAVSIISLMLTSSITRPLNGLGDTARQVAIGDLRVQVQDKHLALKDEVGILARALHDMTVAMRDNVGQVQKGVHTLASASTELSTISKQVSDNADVANIKSNTAAAASEQMSTNMNSVAAAMEQTTTNMSTVATAAEEMTATINEMAGNSEKARSITDEAVKKATVVASAMDALGLAAREIGKVTETISAISQQTNMLALNATIEAARAGQAGKGFAVVATEIKELSRQTAQATEDIKVRIKAIQDSTKQAAESIGSVASVISDTNEIVSGIAAAIEEQSVVTRDIAGNVAQASQAVDDANRNVSQASIASRSIAGDVSEVNQSAGDIATASAQVMASAEELANLAEKLRTVIERFKV